ncbi:MAG: hypothetical protein ACKVW3_10785 [Phycisphaerales bacterium]
MLTLAVAIACVTLADPPAKRESLAASVHQRAESILRLAADDGNLAKAAASAAALFDQVIARAPLRDPDPWIEAAWIARATSQLAGLPKEAQRPALALVKKHPNATRTLAMLVSPRDDTPRVYALLAALDSAHGIKVERFAPLTAAMCVVHDAPRTLAANRGKPAPVRMDPIALFDYYADNESRLLFSPRTLAAEGLARVVDSTASIDELRWALTRHAGDRNVGQRYTDLTYDSDAFKRAKPKKIEALDFTLPNLRRVGGVCEEQAYYAEHVAKAIGVPSASIEGRSAELGHVWVGFVQQRGGQLVWNCDEGHYDEYEKLRGTTIDPQTAQAVSDGQLGLSAAILSASQRDRWASVALADAAARLRVLRDSKAALATTWDLGGEPIAAARSTDAAAEIELLRAAVDRCPGSPAPWLAVKALAEKGGLDSATRDQWFEAIMLHAGTRFPDFSYSIVAGMIAGIADPKDQSRAWDWAADRYAQLPDLACEVRLRQGDMWKAKGDPARAYDAWLETLNRYANDSSRVVDALVRAERLLKETKREGHIPEMYQNAWRRISRPGSLSPGAFRGSNFYRVGERLAISLDAAGRKNEADNVRRQIAAGVDKEKP